MRRLALVLALLAAGPALSETRVWDFRVFLDDRAIGRHRFELQARADQRELRSEARFELLVLRVPVYRYDHRASERWRGDCLEALRSRTDDNGERAEVDWRERDGGCTMSFAYWNPRILQAARLLNAQTGSLVPVRAEPGGEAPIEVRGRKLLAQRHRLTGPDLRVDLWYAEGEWVGLDALLKGGRVLRYRLEERG